MDIKILGSILTSLLVALGPSIADGATYVENFTSRTYYDSGTLVWNQSLGQLQPPIEVYNYSGGNEQYSIDLGDGSHGALNSTTYANFGSFDGTSLTINTDNYATGLQVTSFHLVAGVIIRPTGSNPLIVKSLGDITIDGVINCSGGDGQALAGSTEAPAAGSAFCGGAAGGAGGNNIGTSPIAGSSPGNAFAVSGGAPAGAGGNGGGGGGAYTGGSSATAGVGAGGAAGTSAADDGFTELGNGNGGGGGGGGGSATGASSGGGGAAGGGIVQMFSARDITVSGTGQVIANGGAGGGGAGNGGGGGGGGGGSLMMFTLRDMLGSPYGATQVTANGGTGGVTAGGNGGNGANGRTWVVDRLGVLNNGELPASVLVPGGTVSPTEGTFNVTSKEIDLGVSKGILSSVDIQTASSLCGACSVAIEIATSDEASFDPTGLWEAASQVSVKRYLRYKLTLVNGDRTNAPVVTQITLNYTGVTIEGFDFVTGCGVLKSSLPDGQSMVWAMLLLLGLPFLILVSLKFKVASI